MGVRKRKSTEKRVIGAKVGALLDLIESALREFEQVSD